MKFTEFEYMSTEERRNYVFEYIKLNITLHPDTINNLGNNTFMVGTIAEEVSNVFDISFREARFYVIQYFLKLEKEELERVTWMW